MNKIRFQILALILVSQTAAAEDISETRLLGTNVGAMPPLQLVVDATVVAIQDPGTVVIRVPREGLTYQFQWRDSIPLRAKWRRDFDGRRKLAFEDLAEGQRLWVRMRYEPRRIDKITVLRPARRSKNLRTETPADGLPAPRDEPHPSGSPEGLHRTE
ncbi:MAG: hypothetical protein GY719_02485 [bacterium]|nr:hypothetical protein [bacterium]